MLMYYIQSKLNLKDLQKYGNVKELTLDELFGHDKPVKLQLEKPNLFFLNYMLSHGVNTASRFFNII